MLFLPPLLGQWIVFITPPLGYFLLKEFKILQFLLIMLCVGYFYLFDRFYLRFKTHFSWENVFYLQMPNVVSYVRKHPTDVTTFKNKLFMCVYATTHDVLVKNAMVLCRNWFHDSNADILFVLNLKKLLFHVISPNSPLPHSGI